MIPRIARENRTHGVKFHACPCLARRASLVERAAAWLAQCGRHGSRRAHGTGRTDCDQGGRLARSALGRMSTAPCGSAVPDFVAIALTWPRSSAYFAQETLGPLNQSDHFTTSSHTRVVRLRMEMGRPWNRCSGLLWRSGVPEHLFAHEGEVWRSSLPSYFRPWSFAPLLGRLARNHPPAPTSPA